jgi:hypothetical protein
LFKDWIGFSGIGWIDSSGLDLFFRGTIGSSEIGLIFQVLVGLSRMDAMIF